MKFYFELKNQYQESEIELYPEYVTESCTHEAILRAAAISNWVKTQQNSETQIREAS
jgi:hypothetical protein